MDELLIGIDVGTYSSKGVLCRPDGTLVAEARVDHGLSIPRPGYAEHDADEVWWADVVALSRRLMQRVSSGERVAGVAVSAIGPCLLPVDREGRPLRPAILYGVDTRASDQIERLNAEYGRERLLELGGMRLTSQAVGPKILWLRENEPEVYRQSARFLTASSYLVFRLTGEYVIDRHTASHFNPLIDIDSLEWDGRFASGIALLEQLPGLRWSNEVVGPISAAAGAETGLPPGTPVTAGAVDALAEAVSVGAVRPGDLMLMYGSTAFLILVLDRRASHPDLWITAGALEGQYALAAGMATTGTATTWFRDQFAQDLIEAEGVGGQDAYEALAEEAARSPVGAAGLLALPYFSGERTPIHDPDARGVFAGLSLAHTRGDLYRALLEGIAFGIGHNLGAMGESGAPISRLVAVGGGAANRLWLQIVSDVTGFTQLLPERTIGAAYGDAFLAALATGTVRGLDSLEREWVTIADEVHPDESSAERYRQIQVLFHELYTRTRSTVHALGGLSAEAEAGRVADVPGKGGVSHVS
jgi:xylulokinase